MREINLTFANFGNRVIPIGTAGENLAMQVKIDCSAPLAEHPGAHAVLTVNPPSGGEYTGETWTDGTDVYWTVQNSDLLVPGRGNVVLSIIDNLGMILETAAAIIVIQDNNESGALPKWLDDLIAKALYLDSIAEPAAAGAVAAKLIAEAAATNAAASAADAAQYTSAAIATWLEAHPEATTTVQDGAVTRAKLDADLQGKTDAVSDLQTAIKEVGNIPYFTSLILCPDTVSDVTERRRFIKRANSISQERTSATASSTPRTVFFTGSELMVFAGTAGNAVPTANQLVDVAYLIPNDTDRRAVIDFYIDGKQPPANSSTSSFLIYYCTVSGEEVTVVEQVKISQGSYFAKTKGFYRHSISLPDGATHFALGVSVNHNACEFCMTVELSHVLAADSYNTDTTLSIANVPADSKAAGDAISAAVQELQGDIAAIDSTYKMAGNDPYFTSLVLCPDTESATIERRRFIKKMNSISQERMSATANNASRTVFFTGSELMIFAGGVGDAVPTANQLVDVALLTPNDANRRAVIDFYIDGKQPSTSSSTSSFYIYYCSVSDEEVTVVERVKISPMTYFAKAKGFYRHWISIPTGATHFALGVTTSHNACEFCMTVELSHALVSDEQNIAPVINQFVADTDLYVNDYRIINGQLYRVTADVLAGATLTVNTNIVATDVCTEIYEEPKKSTAALFGYDVPGGAAARYGISADYITVLKTAMDAWMAEYSGDTRKIPFILHTDQHGQLKAANKGYFDLISHLANWDAVSAVFNLGDTVQDHWSDSAVTTNPLQRNAELETALKTQSSIPSEKRINVWGNHDTWYSGNVETAVYNVLPSLKYLNPYFPATGLRTVRLPDNSGNMVIYDDAYMVRYLVVGSWDYVDGASPTYQKFYINADHWKWIIKELSTDCGYDLVIVSHVPIQMFGAKCYDPVTYESHATSARYICPSLSYSADLFAARKAKSSGTITVGAESIAYDFTGCNDNLLCSISGHEHASLVDWTGDLLCATFERFGPTSRTIFFALFDRENQKLNAWEVANGDTPGAKHWEAPFAYTAPPTPSQS